MGMKNVYQKYEIKLNLPGRLLLVALMVGLVACGTSENSRTVVQVPIQPVTINVPSALVIPAYTLNGVEFEQSEYNDGNFILRSASSTGDTLMLGSSYAASPAAVRVIQDTYDVLFRHETGDGVPQNVDTQVQANEIVNSDRALSINVLAGEITPSFAQNASSFPVSEYDDGVFYLQPDAGGERIFIGNSHTAVPDPVQVMHGTYDVIYSLETGGSLVPNNQGAVVMTDVSVNADRALDINVASVSFQFDATLDAAAFPASQYQKALFFLRNTSTGDRVELGVSFELPVTLLVVEGTYDIVYQHVQGNDLPVNTDAIVASNVIIDGTSLSIDIASVAITPSFTLDGTAFPQDEYNDANFYLRSTNNNNDVMFLGASEVAPAVVRVISSDMDTDAGVAVLGAYDVLYRHETGEGVPQNANAVVRSNVTLNSDVSPFAVPVSSVEVTGRFTLNGNDFPNDASDSVQFLLRGNDTSDVFLFAFSDISSAPVKLVSMPGSYETYDVIIDHLDGDAVPQNKMHVVKFNELLDANKSLLVSVVIKRVAPGFTLDGMVFPSSLYQSARFYLRDTTTNKRIFLGSSYRNNDAVTVVKGTYEVIYEHRYGETVPQNVDSKVGFIDVK
ncbi:MAG: hypothetical protein GXP18_09930 [Gammaproteobacteria bacterium]|nr:hypothetical protein [Gammaproteobacteria bacterium]